MTPVVRQVAFNRCPASDALSRSDPFVLPPVHWGNKWWKSKRCWWSRSAQIKPGTFSAGWVRYQKNRQEIKYHKTGSERRKQGNQKDGSKSEKECVATFSLPLNMITNPAMGEPAGEAEWGKVNDGTDQIIPWGYGIGLSRPWQGKDDGNDQRDP